MVLNTDAEPLIDQAHGINSLLIARIPNGNGMPITNAKGAIINVEIINFKDRGRVIKAFNIDESVIK